MARPRAESSSAPASTPRSASARAGAAAEKKRIRVTQVKSGIGFKFNQRQILAGLGLSRPGRSVELEDTPSIRGMCKKIEHLVRVDPIA